MEAGKFSGNRNHGALSIPAGNFHCRAHLFVESGDCRVCGLIISHDLFLSNCGWGLSPVHPVLRVLHSAAEIHRFDLCGRRSVRLGMLPPILLNGSRGWPVHFAVDPLKCIGGSPRVDGLILNELLVAIRSLARKSLTIRAEFRARRVKVLTV